MSGQKLLVMMGAPGAGKTTWINRQRLEGFHLASTEALRVNFQDTDSNAFMENFRRKGKEALLAGQSVVVDATNTFPHHRRFWLDAGNEVGAFTELMIFNTDLNLLNKAQRSRTAPVQSKIIFKHHRAMIQAMRDVRNENWGRIQMISRKEDRERSR